MHEKTQTNNWVLAIRVSAPGVTELLVTSLKKSEENAGLVAVTHIGKIRERREAQEGKELNSIFTVARMGKHL